MTKFIGHCLALAAAGALFIAIPGGEASAETATNLNCKGCVGKKEIGKKAVTKKAIKKNSIKAAAIKSGAVTADKLANEAKPTGADSVYDEGPNLGAEAVITSVEITAPSSGYIIATFSGWLQFTAGDAIASCNVTTGTTIENLHYIRVEGEAGGPDERDDIGQTRMFPATEGVNTINLVCAKIGAGTIAMQNVNMTAFFVPNKY
jgi:hypothetical protein